METRWLYTTSENFHELRKAAGETCVIPMGCVEKHGLHLPLGQDVIQASHLAYLASQLESFCVFPDFTFGDVPGTDECLPPGSIMLPVEEEMRLLKLLCNEIGRNGYKKIVVLNGHGGNVSWLGAFQRDLAREITPYVFVIMPVKLAAPHAMAEKLLEEGPDAFPELTGEDRELLINYHRADMKIGHACMGETAYMMGISPESVKLNRLGIESGLSENLTAEYAAHGIHLRNMGWDVNYPNAFSGHDPVGCNERIGKAALRMEAERIARGIKFLKEEEQLMKWHLKNRV